MYNWIKRCISFQGHPSGSPLGCFYNKRGECKDRVRIKEVEAFRSRPIEGNYPFLTVDATYFKVRENARVVSKALMIVMTLPEGMRRFFRTSNHIERLNRELKRRSGVIGIFPNEASLIRLMGSVLMKSPHWHNLITLQINGVRSIHML